MQRLIEGVPEGEMTQEQFLLAAAAFPEDVLIDTVQMLVVQHEVGDIKWLFKSYRFALYFGGLYKKNRKRVFLDKGIDLLKDAVYHCPKEQPSRPTMLGLLSTQLAQRYEETQEISDLEEGLGYLHEALELGDDAEQRQALLSTLAMKFGRLYSRTNSIPHLQKAVKIARGVHETPTVNHEHRAAYLTNFSILLEYLFKETQDLEILDESISVLEEVVQLSVGDDVSRARNLYNLANGLSFRCLTKGSRDDLEAAITASQRAVRLMDATENDRAAYHVQLGNLFRNRYSEHEEESDLQKAISEFQTAMVDLGSPIRNRLLAARYLTRCQILDADLSGLVKTAETTTHLLPLITPRSLGFRDTQYKLSEFAGLASDAAAVMLGAKKDPYAAIEMLELGRGILTNSLAELRTDVTVLQNEYPKLASQFEKLRLELDPATEPKLPPANSNPTLDVKASQNRREAERQLDKLLQEIRKQPGFDRFMLPLSLDEIYKIARNDPIIYINSSPYRCDGIIIRSGRVHIVNLPELHASDTGELFDQISFDNFRLLEWLWDNIARPIMDELGFTGPPSDGAWPHVWWILTGPLSRFPIHAAGYHRKQSSETVIDRVVSSYASSIKTIERSRKYASPLMKNPEKALLIAMERTPGLKRLPFAVPEVEDLQQTFKSVGVEAFLPLQHKQNLISHLPYCQIFHFAGHGYTSESDPLQSALLLRDREEERVTVNDLLQINLQATSPFLAFLSACGTGQTKAKSLVDESMHLISACQLAGFRHVIGTLWKVNDRSCIEMTRLVYSVMIKEDWSDESVARGVHHAGRELRDRWLAEEKGLQTENNKNNPASEGSASSGSLLHAIQLQKDQEIRDAELCKEEDEDEDSDEDNVSQDELDNSKAFEYAKSESWIPYVHFGV